MGRRTPRLAAILLSLALAQQGRAIAAPPEKPFRSVLELRNDGIVRQHWDLSCGAAAIATLLTYQLGDPVTEREAALGMLHAGDVRLVRARLGFSLLDLKRFAASRGFEAVGYGGLTLDELVGLAPVVVPIRVHGYAHFVVLRGRRDDQLLLGDPAFGNRTMSTARFVQSWPSRVGFVVRPPGVAHPPNRMGAPPELFPLATAAALRAADHAVRAGAGAP